MTHSGSRPYPASRNITVKKVFSRLKTIISGRSGSTRELESFARSITSDDGGNPQSNRTAARKNALRLVQQLEKEEPDYCWDFKEIEQLSATRSLLAASPDVQIEFIRRYFEKVAALREKLGSPKGKEVYY